MVTYNRETKEMEGNTTGMGAMDVAELINDSDDRFGAQPWRGGDKRRVYISRYPNPVDWEDDDGSAGAVDGVWLEIEDGKLPFLTMKPDWYADDTWKCEAVSRSLTAVGIDHNSRY